jgi:hypothetical protein
MTDAEVTETTVGEPSRRNFLRYGAFGAAAAAAASVAGIAGAGEANAANGSTFLIGSAANSASATTQLSGGSSIEVVNGASYVVSGTTHAAIAASQAENGSIALYGKDTSTQGATGVRGDGYSGVVGNGYGVLGAGVTGTAVNGSSTGFAAGVRGAASSVYNVGVQANNTAGDALSASSTNGSGAALSSSTGTGAYVTSGSGPALRVGPSGLATVPPTSGTWTAGSVLQKNGALYYCWKSGTGTAAKWVRMSGALVLLPTPKRAYDSRLPGSGGILHTGTDRIVDLTITTGMPAGVSAALLTLTVLNTSAAGYITAYRNGVAFGGGRSVSWYTNNQQLTSSTSSAVDALGKIKIRAGGQTHVLVDVVGYYP